MLASSDSSSRSAERRISNDLWAGLAATLVALPAAIAYGVATYGSIDPTFIGYGVRAGLIGAVVLGIIASAIGGSSQLITVPSAPAAAVLASFAATLMTSLGGSISPERCVGLLVAVSALAGILQLGYGAAGGGRLIKYIPYPVVAGYLSAVAMMIFLGQVPKFLGGSGTSLGSLILSPSAWRWPAIIVGMATMTIMVLAARLTRAVPSAIIALLGGIATYFALAAIDPSLLQLEGNSLVLGRIGAMGTSGSAPTTAVSAILALKRSDLHLLIAPAITLSVLLSADTLKTCVVVDALTFQRHASNRTLVGQGLANVISACGGGMPGSGMMGATMVNVESGGRTRLAGILEGVFVALAVLAFGRWIAWIPISALAGILLVVAGRMYDWSSFHLLRQRSTVLDFSVIATVVIVAVFSNLIAAAGAGVALAMVLFIRDHARGTVVRRKVHGAQISSKQHRLPSEHAILEKYGGEITVCELQGSLFFGTTDQLFRDLEADLVACRFLILDLRRVQSLDFTATHLFEQFEAVLGRHGGWLLFSRVPLRPELRNYFSAHGAADRHRNTKTFETLDDALQWSEDRQLDEYLPGHGAPEAPLDLFEFELLRDFADPTAARALAGCVVERSVAADGAIFKAGEISDELFLIRRGVVRIAMPLNGAGYHTLASFGAGHFFGEMAFLVGGVRSANAVATAATDLFVVSRARFDIVARDYPSAGQEMFERLACALAVRLRRTDFELRTLYDA